MTTRRSSSDARTSDPTANRSPEKTTATLADNVSTRTGFGIGQINVAAAFRDPDGDTLEFTVTGLPGGLSFDEATGFITGSVRGPRSWNLEETRTGNGF